MNFLPFDPAVSQWFESLRVEPVTFIMKVLSWSAGGFLILLPLLAFWLWRRHTKFRFAVVFAFGLGIIINNLVIDTVKVNVSRPRPCEAGVVEAAYPTMINPKKPHRSFPSGHSGNSIGAIILALWLWPKVKPWLLVFPFLIGISRIYLGAHYLSDVLAGWVIGAIMCNVLGFIFWKVLNKLKPRLDHTPETA